MAEDQGLVLVLNGGSSSLKFQLIEPDSGSVIARGLIERIGQSSGDAQVEGSAGAGSAGADSAESAGDEPGRPEFSRAELSPREASWQGAIPDHGAALAIASRLLAEINIEHAELRAVGHRVVHGGTRFRQPVLINDEVLQTVRDLAELAPLHNPANAALIGAAQAHFPDIPHVAVFDTAFFADLPTVAITYAIDRTIAARHGVRRYGFHGISHQYVSRQTGRLLDRDAAEINQIVLHLGNGASISAIRGGRPVDTSMGLTPLEGLVMGTRGGDIDPGALIHLMRAGFDAEKLATLLNYQSGLKGLTGSIDMRDVQLLADQGSDDAKQALELYCYRARKYIGSYLAVLGRIDAIAFTAGVGENAAEIRSSIMAGLEPFGISIDAARNSEQTRAPRLISPADSAVAVAVIPTNEELAIAQAATAVAAANH